MRHTKLAAGAAALALIGGGAAAATLSAGAAVTPTTVTVTTQVSNYEDTGHGTPAAWASKDFTRTLTVTADPTIADCASLFGKNFDANADTCYTATIADNGSLDTIPGAGQPNPASPSDKIAHAVTGTVTGTYSYTLYAPNTDTFSATSVQSTYDAGFTKPADTIPASDDVFSNDDWPAQAFTDGTTVGAGVVIKGGAYSWTYATGCETWTDASNNDDGGVQVDGNITGEICPVPPHVKDGQWLSRSASRATVGWLDSDRGWPNKNNKCVQVYITGYGFAHIGDYAHAHIGFTCGTTGYLAGLEPDHTYALRIVPATGVYGAGKNTPIAGAPVGYVDVFTLADATDLGLPLS